MFRSTLAWILWLDTIETQITIELAQGAFFLAIITCEVNMFTRLQDHETVNCMLGNEQLNYDRMDQSKISSLM